MTESKILELARKYGDVRGGGPTSISFSFTDEGLQQLVRSVLTQGADAAIEECIAACEKERLEGDSDCPEDDAYESAIKDCIFALQMLAAKPVSAASGRYLNTEKITK